MILKDPFYISSRLLPAIKVGEIELSYCLDTNYFYFDYKNKSFTEKNFRNKRIVPVQDVFNFMLTFMSAGAEVYCHSIFRGKSGDFHLFCPWLMEALYINSDEISIAQTCLEENKDLIITSNE